MTKKPDERALLFKLDPLEVALTADRLKPERSLHNVVRRALVTECAGEPPFHPLVRERRHVAPPAVGALATGKLLRHPDIGVVAERYDKSVAQLCIR